MHFENDEQDQGIGYDIIILQDIMIQIGLIDTFQHNILKWDISVVPMIRVNKPNLDMEYIILKTATKSFHRKPYGNPKKNTTQSILY